MMEIAFVALLGGFMFAVLNLRRDIGPVWTSAIYTFLVCLFLFIGSENIGKPKPLWTELRDLNGAIVIAAVPVEDEAIYIWVIKDGPPIAYVLPWSDEKAQELQDAMREAAANNTHVVVEEGGGGGEDSLGEFSVHAAPQTPMPEKNYDQQ